MNWLTKLFGRKATAQQPPAPLPPSPPPAEMAQRNLREAEDCLQRCMENEVAAQLAYSASSIAGDGPAWRGWHEARAATRKARAEVREARGSLYGNPLIPFGADTQDERQHSPHDERRVLRNAKGDVVYVHRPTDAEVFKRLEQKQAAAHKPPRPVPPPMRQVREDTVSAPPAPAPDYVAPLLALSAMEMRSDPPSAPSPSFESGGGGDYGGGGASGSWDSGSSPAPSPSSD